MPVGYVAGTLTQVGQGVSRFVPGDEVFAQVLAEWTEEIVREILLIAKGLVCCDDCLESCCFGGLQQISIFEQVPALLKSGRDFVASK